MVMHDCDIRDALRDDLRRQYGADPETAIIDELSIQRAGARIDVALVNGVLHGFELKSDRDTLSRLARQAQAYDAVCDHVTLVVGERLVRNAVELVPNWWGVKVARLDSWGMTFRDLKLSQRNPAPNPIAVAQLLRRDEAHGFLAELGCATGIGSLSRKQLCLVLTQEVGFANLRQRVRQCIRARQSAAQLPSCGD